MSTSRTKKMHDRRRELGLCINGLAFVLEDDRRFEVVQFSDGGAVCKFKRSGELVELPVAEVKLDPEFHGPAVPTHGRCEKCWRLKKEGEKAARDAAQRELLARAQAAADAVLPGARVLPPRKGGRKPRSKHNRPKLQLALGWVA